MSGGRRLSKAGESWRGGEVERRRDGWGGVMERWRDGWGGWARDDFR